MDYLRITSALEKVSSACRREKADSVVPLLSSLDEKSICLSVRLIMGDLWPVWKSREMGVGPQMIISALEELSSLDVNALMEKCGEIGAASERALERKSQQALSHDHLSVDEVYCDLIKISEQSGDLADTRKMSILRGLFLKASPQEAKYISRAIVRKMLTGLGPQTMILAIAEAFGSDLGQVRRAYALMPDIGDLALEASKGTLGEIRASPSVPLRPMLIPPGKSSPPGTFLFRYPGLKVQVHSLSGKFFVYTARLRNITGSLASLSGPLRGIGRDFIAEADLICCQKGAMLKRDEVVRYVNRKRCSRRISVVPALVASDLLFLDGEDLTGLKYSERREALTSLLEGHSQSMPGISISQARALDSPEALAEMCRQSISMGFGSPISRDLDAPYFPGTWSRRDFVIKEDGINTLEEICTRP